jgi:SNF2 family DNA or RNA helicase
MLIVAPKSVLPAWQSDAARLIGPELEITVLTGNADRRRGAIRRRHDVMVSSYESTAAELSALLRHLLATKARYLLVVDESYFVKNPSTRRARALAELRRVCERAVVLSGTPAPNRAWDLVNQVNLADGGVAFAGASKPSDPDEERSQVATRLGSAAILRRLKTDVLPDLPSQSHREIQVELAPEQRSLYERAARDLLLDVRGVNDKEFLRDLRAYLARRNTLLQLCSHPGAIVPDYQETPAKFIALDDLVHDLVEVRREKVVIWSWFRYSLDVIASRYAHHGLVRIDGSVPSLDARSAAVDRFQRDPDVRVFVGNAAAAGAGLTLTAARVAIYESFSNQAAHYMQSLDRIHRRGQRRDVTYAVLISSRTVEAAEFERLVAKQLQARDLLGDDRPGRPARAMFAAELEEGLESEVAR